jgi:hypothetical protein
VSVLIALSPDTNKPYFFLLYLKLGLLLFLENLDLENGHLNELVV